MGVVRDPVCHRVRNPYQQNITYSGTHLFTDEYQWIFSLLLFSNAFMQVGSDQAGGP